MDLLQPYTEVNRRVKNHIRYWFEKRKRDHMNITDVQTSFFREDDTWQMNVQLTAFRPGIIIGKGGRDIDSIRDMLQDAFNVKVKMGITENKTW